jgi:Fe-S-cluster-containing dehydrogenase component
MKVYINNVKNCIGCYNCQIACKDEHCGNDWMPYTKPQPETGQFWNRINCVTRGTVPRVKLVFIYDRCNHCDNPFCMPVCPV